MQRAQRTGSTTEHLGGKMSTLVQQIEQMRSRMEEIAKSDGRLVAALAEALKRADEKLLNDVVELAEEHEARRSSILEELQALACRLGAFPRQIDQLPSEERAPRELEAHQAIPINLNVRARGDWRDGILLDEEINNHLRRRSAG
jgi:cell division septum initiation protein DivIVA